MATAESVKTKIQNLIAMSNAITGNNDLDLTTAVNSLVSGYGQGGGGDDGLKACLESLLGRTILSIKTDATKLADMAFGSCKDLETVDLTSVTSFTGNPFYSCYSLKNLVLRPNSVVSASSSTQLSSCKHITGDTHSTYNPNGYKDGFIFVPSFQYTPYTANTNWSTYASQIRMLEKFTVDGTTTGELDMVKVQAERDKVNGVT